MEKNILFARHGLKLDDWLKAPTSNAGQLRAKLDSPLLEEGMEPDDGKVIEWIQVASLSIASPGPGMLVDPLAGDLPLTDFDPYVRGVVRWLNELGIYTTGCCDGHGERPAKILLKKYPDSKQVELLNCIAPDGIESRIDGKKLSLVYPNGEQHRLLMVAEHLYRYYIDARYLLDLQAKKFRDLLIELLSIPGCSMQERVLRLKLGNKIRRLMDHTFIDRKGNLLGFADFGEGPTILLSAHMDTVEEISPNREILEEGTILSSSEGILGADDRAGMAAIIEILKRIRKTNFNGKIKVAFTVEEEIGCRGAREIPEEFMEDVDAAIVIDRRDLEISFHPMRELHSVPLNSHSFLKKQEGLQE